MKTKIKWLLLSIILSITSIDTASAYERTFDGTERVFFKNIKPSGWGDCWICASRTGWVHFWRSGYANTSDVKLTLVSGTEGAEGAIYVCTPAAGTYTDVTIVRSSTSATMTWSEKSKDISVGSDASLNFINNLSPSDWGTNYGHWAKYAPTPSVVGSMNGWKAEANPATSSRYSSSDKVQIIPVELSASTNYTFLIADGENQYGKSSLTITGATKDGSWEQYSTGDNKTVTLTTGEAGTYYFQYNTASKYVAVYYPKSHIAKNKVLYFDARNSTHEHWTGDFHVKYVYKYYDSGSNLSSGAEQYGETKLEDGVFYTTVPNVDHVGQVQLVSVYSNNHGSQKAYSNNGYGTGRSSSKQNCLMIKAENANWDITWEPGWQTYCPPMSSASISDNSTAVISWTSGTGTSENPYLVPSTGTIKVSASATSAVDDDNMTKKYDFKVNTGSGASSAQSGNSSTFNKTSLGNNTTYEISLDVWNNYNSTDGTKYTSATHKWYKALDVYTVSHSLTNMTTASGRTGSEAAAYGIAYTATFNQVTGYNRPASVTVMRGSTNITANCTWNQSTGELTIPAEQVSGNITITVAGEAQVYNITYRDKDNAEFTGTQAGAPTTHTYGTPTDLIMPTREHYEFAGWFTASNCASGQIGNTTAAQIGATAFTGDITLYAKWTEITHTVSFDNDGHGTTTPNTNQTVGEVTGVAINASNSTGYTFNTWTSSNGGSFASAVTTASNTFYPTDGDATLTASFSPKQYNITLSALSDQVGGGESTTEGSAKVTYMGTTLTNISAPTRPGYEVDYYTRLANGNDKITTNNTGTLTALSSYVSDQGKWIYDNNLTLYAHWVPRTYTITLDANRGGISGTDGSTSFTVTSGANNFDFDPSTEGRQSMTPPTKEGYTYAGYYDDPDDGEGTKVINADGSKPATSYVNSDGNWINSDDDLTLYAHWTDNHIYYYNGATADGWSTASNWTKGAVPASDGSNTIHILKPLVISSDKKVAAVDIITSGTYTPTGGSAIDASGKLTINPNVGLNVTGTVTRTADATSNLATREGDLVLESSSAGNASLIFNNSNSDAATVQMYSKASISGETWKWQYVGTPFTGSIPLYNYYGSWMYKWYNGGWEVVKGSDELTPFAGYCLTQESATTHVMGGTLVPTTSKSVTMSASTDMVLANSWTAPIYIGGFTASTFTSTPATIYLFNTGSAENGSSAGSEAGTYVAIPIFTTPYVGGGLIAPMQGFFVTTNGGSAGTITMNYADLVRPADSRSIVAGPMYAPKRAEEGNEPVLQDQPEEAPTVLKIWANGSVYNDRLVILAREDFSEGFDNGWDGRKMSFGVASPSVYVINAQGGYDAVSAIPTLEGTVVGFRAGSDNQYTMMFSYDGEDEWFLNDQKTETSTLITNEQTYTFSAAQADGEARFVISKMPIHKTTTGNDAIYDGVKARKQMIDGILYIIRDGRIYDATGSLVK